MNQPDMNQPDMNQPDMNQPDMNQHDMNQPDMNQPDMNQHDMNKSPTDDDMEDMEDMDEMDEMDEKEFEDDFKNYSPAPMGETGFDDFNGLNSDLHRHTHTISTLTHSHTEIPGHTKDESKYTSFAPESESQIIATSPVSAPVQAPIPVEAPAQDPIIRYKQVIDLSTLENGNVKQIALYNELARKINFPSVIFLKAGDVTSTDEVRFNDKVYIVKSDDPNMVLNFVHYRKNSSSRVKNYKALNRKLMFVNLFKDDKQYYVFRLRPMIGEDKKPLKRREPIQSGDRFTIGYSKDYYNQCGFGGCRVLNPIRGVFSHGGKEPKKVPFVIVNKTK